MKSRLPPRALKKEIQLLRAWLTSLLEFETLHGTPSKTSGMLRLICLEDMIMVLWEELRTAELEGKCEWFGKVQPCLGEILLLPDLPSSSLQLPYKEAKTLTCYMFQTSLEFLPSTSQHSHLFMFSFSQIALTQWQLVMLDCAG